MTGYGIAICVVGYIAIGVVVGCRVADAIYRDELRRIGPHRHCCRSEPDWLGITMGGFGTGLFWPLTVLGYFARKLMTTAAREEGW